MGQYNAAVLTTAGQALIASAIAQETPLIFTKMRTSSTVIPAGTNLENLTSLSGIKQSVDITSTLLYDSQTIQTSANFPNTEISTAYYVQTIGVYGQITGGAETLIAVCTAISPDEMPVYDPDSPASIIYKVQLRYANAEQVTLVVNDTGTASVEDLSLKVSKAGGDIAKTVVSAVTPSTASYPTISAGDTVKVIAGKVNKSISDLGKVFEGSDGIHQGKKGLVPAPPVISGRYATGLLDNGAGWTPLYSDKGNLQQYGNNGTSLASGNIICDIISIVDRISVQIDVSTVADFITFCRDTLPAPVPTGKTVCVYLTAQTTNALVGVSVQTIGTLCITDNGTAARLLISRTSDSALANTFAVTVVFGTQQVIVDRLATAKAIEGVGGSPASATDVISVATSLAANTYLTCGSLTLDKGVYNLEGTVRFTGIPANARLSLCISGATSPQTYTLGLTQEYVGTTGTGTFTKSYNRTVRVTSDGSPVYFVVATSSASTVDFSRFQAVKIAIAQ